MMRMPRISLRLETAIALLALFFALGGSALAVGEHVQGPSVAQKRCANGSVRGIAVVTGIPSQGIANLPGNFTGAGDLLRPEIQLHRASRAGPAGRGGCVRSALRRDLWRERSGSSTGDAMANVEPVPGGAFRVVLHPAGRDDKVDLPFTVVVV